MSPDTGEVKRFTEEQEIPAGWLDVTPGRTLKVTTELGRELLLAVVDVNTTQHIVRLKLVKP